MNFENPIWLVTTPIIVLVFFVVFAVGLRRREDLLQQFAAARLLDRLTEKANLSRIFLKGGLIALALALISIALARPQYGIDFVERKARGLDIVFVLDSSKSMLATDLRPSRLERAKLSIADLINRLESDRIGLVVFSGSAFLQIPPTLDYSAFRENLNAIGPDSISRGGSDIGQALREAVKAFPKDNNYKVVVLLTDGEDLAARSIETAREIAEDGIKVYSIGIGTSEGTYLKVKTENGNEEFIRDSRGQPVRSQLDETTLQKIAQLTGGSYSRLNSQSLETLYDSVLATLPREERESEMQETRIERFQWLLALALVCLIIELLTKRRGKKSSLFVPALILMNLANPTTSEAQETDMGFQNESIDSTEFEALPDDPRRIFNKAHESLTEGNYTEAKYLYEKVIKSSEDLDLERDALYNMAHALNQIGEVSLQEQDFQKAVEIWKQAEELFEAAKELDPSDTTSIADAKQMEARRVALEELIQQQKKEDQEPQQNSDDSKKQESGDESDETEQNESDDSSTNEESSETDDSESKQEQDTSEQQQSKNEESVDERNGQSSDSEQTQEEDSQSAENSESEKTDNEAASESTGNPAEDMQQENEVTSTEEENADVSENEMSETIQPNPSQENTSAEGEETTATIERMQLSDAQALLDSLRNAERLLPFTESSEEERQRSQQNGNNRDW